MIKDSVSKVAPANIISDTGFDKDALRSTASFENIPSDLIGLGDDIREISEKVYGEWVAINWHGSIPRGDFVFGDSDADFDYHQGSSTRGSSGATEITVRRVSTKMGRTWRR
jgi:hypothetical protein